MNDKLILGIETSCDETSAAVVKNGRTLIAEVTSTQIDIHRIYGGVVPEIASRNHLQMLPYVVADALYKAGLTLGDIDAVGVTYGPGLVGALLVGLSYAKALAYASKKTLIGVHHIKGHIAANYLQYPDLVPPFLGLVVSGGHTNIVHVRDYCDIVTLGRQ
jgi:N6-L-threonylcarbamoyladenine synthase